MTISQTSDGVTQCALPKFGCRQSNHLHRLHSPSMSATMWLIILWKVAGAFFIPNSIKRVWGAKCWNFFGAISKENLSIPLEKVKFADKFCIANFINASIYTRNRIRVRLGALIDFSKVCHKSKGTIWFWNQNTWGTLFTFAWINYVIL